MSKCRFRDWQRLNQQARLNINKQEIIKEIYNQTKDIPPKIIEQPKAVLSNIPPNIPPKITEQITSIPPKITEQIKAVSSNIQEPNVQKIPIFIIVHDRVEVLKKTVKSFKEQIKTPIEIIFHDVASTFPPCLQYLQEMRVKGYAVYRSAKNHHHTVLDTIKKYLHANPTCEYYVVSDPDIELDRVHGDILTIYTSLLQKFGKHLVIGPMLRIDDIPQFYPKRQLVINLHRQQFWRHRPTPVTVGGKRINILRCKIDTTFQLAHRSNLATFPRAGIRCYAPYAARHLDWYINPENMTADQVYYSKHATGIAHWGRGFAPSTPLSAQK